MKLYDYPSAPNPRRVRVYLAEKGIEVDIVNADIMKGEHKTPGFLAKNMNGQIPVLELDDGTCIAESLSICRYFEAIHPEPPLFGSNPVELATIDMHLRRIELLLFRHIGTSWVNGPVVAKVAAGRFEQIPDEHHDHLIDVRTGKVIEFRNEEIEAIQEVIARKLGFKLVDHRLELYGVPLEDKLPDDKDK